MAEIKTGRARAIDFLLIPNQRTVSERFGRAMKSLCQTSFWQRLSKGSMAMRRAHLPDALLGDQQEMRAHPECARNPISSYRKRAVLPEQSPRSPAAIDQTATPRRTVTAIVIGVALAVISLPIAAAGDVRWHDAATVLVWEAQQLLIEKKLCISVEDCANRQLVLFNTSEDGIDLGLYSIVEPETVSTVAAAAAKVAVSRGVPIVRIRAYRGTKVVELSKRSIFGNREVIEIEIRSRYANR